MRMKSDLNRPTSEQNVRTEPPLTKQFCDVECDEVVHVPLLDNIIADANHLHEQAAGMHEQLMHLVTVLGIPISGSAVEVASDNPTGKLASIRLAQMGANSKLQECRVVMSDIFREVGG